jgi:hypothetical protein
MIIGSRSRAVLRAVGLSLVIAAVGLAFGEWDSTRQPLETMARMEKNRHPADSSAYEHAAEHAGWARETLAKRWHITGYATLGILGTLAGASLFYAGISRRTRGGGVAAP